MSHIRDDQQPCWGFGRPMPSLQQLLLLATSRQGTKQLPGSSSCDAVEQTPLNMLEQTSAFASNASVASMAESMGLSALTTSLAGTLMTCPTQPRDTSTTFAAAATGGPSNPCGSRQVQHQAPAHTGSALENSLTAAAEVAKAMVWRQVDNAWAVEAVKRGVAYAKSGDYQQAMGCYDKALELDPDSCDALVARGAAHANQGRWKAAVADFEAALKVQPDNANAAKYLIATQRHVADTAGAESSPDLQEHKQQQQQCSLQDDGNNGPPSSRHTGGVSRCVAGQHTQWSAGGSKGRGWTSRQSSSRSRSRSRRRRRVRSGSRSRTRSRDRSSGRDRSNSRSRSRRQTSRVGVKVGATSSRDAPAECALSSRQADTAKRRRGSSWSRSRSRDGNEPTSSESRSPDRSNSSSTGGGTDSPRSDPAAALADRKLLSLSDIRAAIHSVRSAQKAPPHSKHKSSKKLKHKKHHKKHHKGHKHSHKKSRR